MSAVSKSVAISPTAAQAAGCTAQCPGVQTDYPDGWAREYTLSATAASGWQFVKFTWSKVRHTASGTTPIGDYESSSNPSTAADGLAEARVYGDKTYWQENLLENIVAHFEQTTPPITRYTLYAQASPNNGGEVKVGSSNWGSTASQGNIVSGTSCRVYARPALQYRFVSWSDGGAQEHDVTLYSNLYLAAYFEYAPATTYLITASASPANGGTVSFRGTPGRSTISIRAIAGSTVSLVATPANGWRFLRWSDGGAQTHDIVATSDMDLIAYFKRLPTHLLVNSYNLSYPIRLVYDPATNLLVANY